MHSLHKVHGINTRWGVCSYPSTRLISKTVHCLSLKSGIQSPPKVGRQISFNICVS